MDIGELGSREEKINLLVIALVSQNINRIGSVRYFRAVDQSMSRKMASRHTEPLVNTRALKIESPLNAEDVLRFDKVEEFLVLEVWFER